MACRGIRVRASFSTHTDRGLFPGVLQVTMLVIGLCLYPLPSSSGIFDMFSFFTKKRPPAPTTVHPALGAQLVKEDNFPDIQQSSSSEDFPLRCQEVRVEGKQVFFDSGPEGMHVGNTGYLVEGKDIQNPLIFIRNSNNGREKDVWFELWTVETNKNYILKNRLTIEEFHPAPNPKTFFAIQVMAIGCLPNRQLLVAIDYSNPAAEFALYRFDIDRLSFAIIYDSVSHNRQNKYFEQMHLDSENTLAIYYSGRTRQASELYFNYYNHILLFTPAHPEGIEILKLGIDIGNVKEWFVIDKKLFLKTSDGRDYIRDKQARIGYWSLNLSQLL